MIALGKPVPLILFATGGGCPRFFKAIHDCRNDKYRVAAMLAAGGGCFACVIQLRNEHLPFTSATPSVYVLCSEEARDPTPTIRMTANIFQAPGGSKRSKRQWEGSKVDRGHGHYPLGFLRPSMIAEMANIVSSP